MMTNNKILAAAIQVNTVIGDVSANLKNCEDLVTEACAMGATWVALPEFFNTGVSWDPSLAHVIEDELGVSAQLLQTLSEKHAIVLGGSFLCRVPEGGVRNRYLCFNQGKLVGRHDKDYPTMWESAFYEGGDSDDTGIVGNINGFRVGSAVCWEFLRTGTSRRLRNKVDVIIGGSHWWSTPTSWPTWLQNILEPSNRKNSIETVQDTARLIGAPIIHASHCNEFSCKIPGLPLIYQGFLEGNAAIVDAKGTVLASRSKEEGAGIVLAELELGAVEPTNEIPNRFWLRNRGLLPAFSWHYHGALGRRWYKKYIR